jgi:ATP-binding cassette subfamily F protein 3
MSVVVGEGLAKYYGAQDVFADVSFQIAHGDHIALVGANGTGKTTLLRIIAGLEAPTAGRVSMAKSVRMGYLSQKAALDSARTVYQEMDAVFADLHAQQEQLHQLEHEMANPEHHEKAMERYGELQQVFELAGGYTYEQEIKRVLLGLGFAEATFDQPLKLLSGGQRTRARLAQLLLLKPDVLLLDEPTNHLDLQATQWLEDYLQQWKGSFVVVAHDRYFLDQVANRVWEMNAGTLEQYSGNYSHYVQLNAERRSRQLEEFETQQDYIARTEDFIRRYKAGQRAREARGRETRLGRLERLQRPAAQKVMKFALSSRVRGGNNVLTIRGLTVGYGQPLIRFPNLLLRRGERAALLGPNGCGKTTFLKSVVGELPPLAGEAKVGVNVQVAYLAQGHENLHEDATILDEILAVKNLPLDQARGFLGRFLFSGDDVFKTIANLSGGERGRVALAVLSLQGANFLLLDEPTNQLDIQSQEMLEQVLDQFDGTILFVSHDRYFIDALATQVWVIVGTPLGGAATAPRVSATAPRVLGGVGGVGGVGGLAGENWQVRAYSGNYSAYLEQAQAEKARSEGTLPARKRGQEHRHVDLELQRAQKLARQREERRAELEATIDQLETRLSTLTQELEQASRDQRIAELYDLGRDYADVQEELQQRLEDWAAVAGTPPRVDGAGE